MTISSALAAGPASAWPGQDTDTSPPPQAGGLRHEAWYPLQRPDEVPASLSVLTCAPALVNMGDGKMRGVLAYNGRFPGPTWEARTGDRVAVQLRNGLSEPTITHWHGLVVDFPNDGGPLLSIGANETYDYSFPIVQRASLNFYHPHPHMLTGKQVCLGLAGAFIIRDAEEDALHQGEHDGLRPGRRASRMPGGGTRERPRILQDSRTRRS